MKKTDYERYVLGSLLFKTELFEIEAQDLQAKWFSKENHEMAEKIIAHRKIRTVMDIFDFSSAQGVDQKMIMSWIENVPNPENYFLYKKQLLKLFESKLYQISLQGFAKRLEDDPNTIDEVYGSLQGIRLTSIDQEITFEDGTLSTKRIIERKKQALISGVPAHTLIGMYGLDDYVQLNPSQLIVIGARPGIGKSAFAINIARKLIQHSDVAFIGFEMTNDEVHTRLIVRESLHNEQYLNTESGINMMEKLQGEKEKEWNRIHYYDAPVSVESLVQLLTIQKKKHNIKYAFVDYIGLLSTDKRYNNSNESTTLIVGQLRKAASQLKICIFVLSQLSRDIEKRTNKEPVLSDLRDSGSIEQDANIVLFLDRPQQDQKPLTEQEKALEDFDGALIKPKVESDQMFVYIKKNRNGKTGSVVLKYIPELFYIDSQWQWDKYDSL